MQLQACDICKSILSDEGVKYNLSARMPRRYKGFDVCEKCAQPLRQFLIEHKLIESDEIPIIT